MPFIMLGICFLKNINWRKFPKIIFFDNLWLSVFQKLSGLNGIKMSKEFDKNEISEKASTEYEVSIKTKKEKSFDTKKLVGMAMFAALAYAVTFVFRIPVLFLTFDAKDAVITIASLIYGPLAGLIISFVVALVELVSISGTGLYGFLMNFASSAAFSAVAALVYKYKRNASGAILAFYAASLSMVAVMMGMNLLVTPYYMGTDIAAVASMIPTLLLPFNFAKALMNSAFAMLLYKPVTAAMRRAKLLKGESKMSFNKSSLSIIITALVTLVAAIVIFVILK